MANVSGGTLTVVLASCNVLLDGSAQINLRYTTAGERTLSRSLNVPANRTRAITDDSGRTVSNTVPNGLATAIDAFVTQLDGLVATGAAAGKLDL